MPSGYFRGSRVSFVYFSDRLGRRNFHLHFSGLKYCSFQVSLHSGFPKVTRARLRRYDQDGGISAADRADPLT